jgi:hypothetical protein
MCELWQNEEFLSCCKFFIDALTYRKQDKL